MPLITMFHHSQLPATPFAATSPVTTSGVSAAKVVATIAAPASHHGTWRPDRKYSSRLSPPRFAKMKPITVDSAKYATTMAQSIAVMFIGEMEGKGDGEGKRKTAPLSRLYRQRE